jgi:chemotaxis protein MotA
MKINLWSIASYVAVGAFTWFSVTKLTSDPSIFLNKEAIVVILGGLAVASVASFPASALRRLFHSLKKIALDPPALPVHEARELVRLSLAAQGGVHKLESELERVEHPFLKEALELVLDGVPRAQLIEILDKRIDARREVLSQDANILMTLAKYCPALGLAATVLGLVELLSKLGNASIGDLGLGMAVALSATFYGIVVANLVFTPLSELLLSAGEIDHTGREMIGHGVLAIVDRKHPLLVGEGVNSYLPISERFDVSELVEAAPEDKGGERRMSA